jgi:hypothetical protein
VNIYPYSMTNDSGWVPESRYAYSYLRSDQRSSVGWALIGNQTLSDDFYADFTPTAWRPDHDLYIPDLALGRLIETPEEMLAGINDYLGRGGQVNLTRAAISGYDFIKDAGQRECETWTTDGLTTDCALTQGSFSAADLIARMLSTPVNVAAINGHAAHFGHQAPDRTAMYSQDVRNAAADQGGKLFYTLGCQSGLNVPPGELNELDLAQAFAARSATYVANTGYGYGLKSTIGLSERLMTLFTQELAEGTATTVGHALVSAKQQYRLTASKFTYYDEKILVESTLYGLPMLRVNTPAGPGLARQATPAEAAGVRVTRTAHVRPERVTPLLAAEFDAWVPDASLAGGLSSVEYGFYFPSPTTNSTEDGVFYSFGDTALSSPYDPIQPGVAQSLESTLGKAHGTLLLEGTYGDQSSFNPVIEAAADLDAGTVITEPTFSAPGFYPAVPFTTNDITMLSGNSEEALVLSAGQFASDAATERLYDDMTLIAYYSSSADATGPAIGGVSFAAIGASLLITVPVSDASGIYRVYATYTGGVGGEGYGTWQSTRLNLGTGITWTGSIPLASPTWFFIQAVDTAGNVAADANGGAYYLYVGPLPGTGAVLSAGHLTLRWPHLGAQVGRYEVWRSAAPYFAPGSADSTRVANLTGPFDAEVSFTDTEATLDPGTAYFYVVKAIDLCGRPVALSGGMGSFTFGMMPGASP